MFIKRVIQALTENRVNYALAGGYAVSLHGAVRGTVDIDLLVSIDKNSLERVEAAMKSLGLVSRLPVTAGEMARFRDEYIENRNLKVWSFTNPNSPIELVDIMVLYDIKDFEIVRKKTVFGEVRIVSLSDLIRMKTEAGRPQDLADIEALESIKNE